MAIRKKFLESLVGMNIQECEKFCRSLGHDVHRIPPGVSGAPAIATPNTIVLWPAIDKSEENKVRFAAAGDPTELVDQ